MTKDKCKKHNVPLLDYADGNSECPVCIKISGISREAKTYKQETEELIEKKEKTLKEFAESREKGYNQKLALIQYTESSAQKIYDEAKVEIEALKNFEVKK